MFKKILIAIFTILVIRVSAQVNINNYIFSTTGSASLNRSIGSLIDDIDMSSGTTVVLGGSAVTNTTSLIANLNFDFYSGGARFTNFSVTPNGWVGLAGGVNPGILWSQSLFSGARLAPFLGPILNTNTPPLSSMTTSSIGRVHYKLIGTSPSRIGVIEFLRMSINSTVVDDTNTFQVRLYEVNGAIEYVYGRMKVTAGAPLDFNVGFKIAAGSHSVNAGSNTSSTTATNTNTYTANTFVPNLHSWTTGSQRSFRFIPNPPNDPTNFNITNITNSAMTLTWTDASNETGYALYRSIDGGLTYTFVTQLAANTTSFNAVGLPSNTDVYWRLFSFRESLGTQQDNVGTTFNTAVITSITDGNWNNTATWSSGTIPNANDSVLISAGDTVLVNVNNATCLQISISGALHFAGFIGGVTITVNNDLIVNSSGALRSFTTTTGNNTLNIGGSATTSLTNGSIINNGIIDIESGTNGVILNMFGNGNSTITGTPIIFKLRSLQLQKNNNVNNIVDVLTPFTLFTTTNSSTLNMLSGTLKLSCAINLTPYGNIFGAQIIGGINARLWFNHPSAIINSTTIPPTSGTVNYNLFGELRIDDGVLNVGCGNSVLILGNTILRINRGTINVLGGFASNAAGTLIMNGGSLNINPINGTSALPNTTAALQFGANSNLTWTNGTINVINPQTINNNISVNILLGGVKSITGGLLKIGNGLRNGTPNNAINTAGFGLSSTVPLHDVLIDARFDSSSARLVRIVGNFVVGNNLTIESNSSLLPASGINAGLVTILGNLVLNGQIIGNFPIISAPIIGTLSFEGTVNQTISGTGTFNNLANLSVNNTNGLTSSLTNVGKIIRVNLLKGLLTTNGSLTIGSSFSRGTVQIGGIDEFTSAGSFNTIPLFDPTFTSHRFIYGSTSSTLTTGAFNEMPTGTIAISSLTINDINGLLSNRNITILDSLNLGTSNFNIGNNDLSIGNTILETGRILRTTGYVQMSNNGSFGRWYATGSILDNTLNNGFPILSGGQDRSVTLNSDANALTTGGKFTVKHSNISGNSNISPSVIDGIVNVNRISNSNWILNSLGLTVSSFFGLQVSGQMQGMGSVTSLSELRWMKQSLGSGATSFGTGTLNAPIISRLFNQTQVASGITNDTFYVGVNTSSNTLTQNFIAVASGAWDNPLTWNNNAVPLSSNVVIIPSPFNVNLNTSVSTNACDSLAVLGGGTLTISSNTLSVQRNVLCEGTINQSGGNLSIIGSEQAGLNIIVTTGSYNISGGIGNIGNPGGSNRTLLVNGTLGISGTANLTVNGNVLVNNTATFNQTGGDFNIDGNSGTAFTSTLQGKHLLDINTNNTNCSAGNITFIDPPHFTLSILSTHTLRIFASSNTSAFSGSHTFIFGDGISTQIGNNSGFNVDNRKNGVLPVQNIIVNGGNATGRWTATSFSSGSFGLYAKGNVTINAGSELRQTNASQLAIGGNLINNGTLTSTQTFTLGGLGYTISNAQIISGSGIFRNSTASTTSEFTSLTINNGGISFGSSNTTYRVATSLNLTSGLIDAGTNTLKVLSTGSINRTNGYFTSGSLELNYPIGINITKTYFIGSNLGYSPAILTFPTVSTAGDLKLTINNTDHPQISAGCIDNTKSINKFWTINNSSILPYILNANLSYLSSDIDTGITTSNIIGKQFSGSNWNNQALSSVTNTNTLINSISNNGAIQLGELASTLISVSISSSINNVCIGTNITFTAVPVNGGTNPIYQWKKNGTNVGSNSITYSDNSLINNDIITCQITTSILCVTNPTVTSNSVTMIVSTPTASGTILGSNTICAGSLASNLILNGSNGSVIRWESSIAPYNTWTNIINTTNTLSAGVLTQNTKYRAFVQNGSCTAIYSDTATILTNSITAPGAVNGGSIICAGSSSGLLQLSGFTGNILNWESALSPFTTWTSITNTSTILTVGTLTQTTQYRAVVKNGACLAAPSTATTVTVNSTSNGGTISGSTIICSGTSGGTLTLSGENGTILRWEKAISPFVSWQSISNTTNSLLTGTLFDSTKYRAIVQNGICLEAISSIASINVTPTTVSGSISGPTNLCSGLNPGNLILTGNVGNIVRWESAVSPFLTFSTISNTTNIYAPGVLTQTTQFRGVVQSGSCGTFTTASLIIIISSSVSGGNVTAPFSAVCARTASIQNISLNSFSGTVSTWQKATGNSPYTWSNISGTANQASFIPDTTSFITAYRAIVQSGSCGSAVSDSIIIAANSTSIAGTISSNTTTCSNSNVQLTLGGNNGSIVRWESSVSPFSSWTNLSSTSNPYTSNPITAITQFRSIVKNGVCPEVTSNPQTVSITASNSWTGTISNSWHNASNWTCGVPSLTTDVVIGGNNPPFGQPQVFTTASARNIDILGGVNPIPTGLLTINFGASLSLFGNLSLNYGANGVGNIIASAGTLNLTGSIAQTIGTPFHISLVKAVNSIGTLNISGSGDKTFDNIKTTIVNNLNLSNVNLILNDSLIIASTGTISGGSSTSHIKTLSGRLFQNGIGNGARTGNVSFPVGSLNSFNPVVLSNTGTADNFSVKFIPNVYQTYFGETGGVVINNNAVNASWFIKEEIIGGSNINLSLQWNSADELTGFSNNNCYISRTTGSNWFASTSGAASGSNPFVRNLNGITSLNTFGIGSGGTLPVKLIQFSGTLVNKNTQLNWTTASEINNKGFDVERSLNGVNFETISFVKGANNSNNKINYKLNDNLTAISQQPLIIYYRLKQIDFDGTFEYSNIIVVKEINDIVFANDLFISPNPFTNDIQLDFTSSVISNMNLILSDALGRQVYQKQFQLEVGQNNLKVENIGGLSAGVYFAKIESKGLIKIVKLVKN